MRVIRLYMLWFGGIVAQWQASQTFLRLDEGMIPQAGYHFLPPSVLLVLVMTDKPGIKKSTEIKKMYTTCTSSSSELLYFLCLPSRQSIYTRSYVYPNSGLTIPKFSSRCFHHRTTSPGTNVIPVNSILWPTTDSVAGVSMVVADPRRLQYECRSMIMCIRNLKKISFN